MDDGRLAELLYRDTDGSRNFTEGDQRLRIRYYTDRETLKKF
jgi:hypothetical protein